MAISKLDTLKNALVSANALTAVKTDPTMHVPNMAPLNVIAQNGTTVDLTQPTTPTIVKKGKALPAKTMTVDGFEMVFSTTMPNAESLKATVSRATINPWYAVAEWLACQPAGALTIRKIEGSTAKSPMSRIDSAISRARKLGVKNYGKLDAKAGTEKGVWYFIRRP